MKQTWSPATLLSPVPVVMVTVGDEKESNIITVAWTGTVNSDPAMAYISVRPERHSYKLLEKNPEFTINLVPESLAFACDFCGVKSGRDIDKFDECNLEKEKGDKVKTPSIKQCPVSIECKVVSTTHLGSHTMFLGEVLSVRVDEKLIDKNNTLDLSKANLITYAHGSYYAVGDKISTFGFSVKKQKNLRKKPNKPQNRSETLPASATQGSDVKRKSNASFSSNKNGRVKSSSKKVKARDYFKK